jgi:hypothetical protein
MLNKCVIIYGDSDYPTFGKNFWSENDISDVFLLKDQKKYPYLNIERVKVSDILNSNNIEYTYIKNYLTK